jgi:hypothetical protein
LKTFYEKNFDCNELIGGPTAVFKTWKDFMPAFHSNFDKEHTTFRKKVVQNDSKVETFLYKVEFLSKRMCEELPEFRARHTALSNELKNGTLKINKRIA